MYTYALNICTTEFLFVYIGLNPTLSLVEEVVWRQELYLWGSPKNTVNARWIYIEKYNDILIFSILDLSIS